MAGTDAYNGWSNYETWLVNLWLNSEPTGYELVCAASAASEDGDADGAGWLREQVEEGLGIQSQPG